MDSAGKHSAREQSPVKTPAVSNRHEVYFVSNNATEGQVVEVSRTIANGDSRRKMTKRATLDGTPNWTSVQVGGDLF